MRGLGGPWLILGGGWDHRGARESPWCSPAGSSLGSSRDSSCSEMGRGKGSGRGCRALLVHLGPCLDNQPLQAALPLLILSFVCTAPAGGCSWAHRKSSEKENFCPRKGEMPKPPQLLLLAKKGWLDPWDQLQAGFIPARACPGHCGSIPSAVPGAGAA